MVTEKDSVTEWYLSSCLFVCSGTSPLTASSVQAFLLTITAVMKEVIFYIFKSPIMELVLVVDQVFFILVVLRMAVTIFLMLTCY